MINSPYYDKLCLIDVKNLFFFQQNKKPINYFNYDSCGLFSNLIQLKGTDAYYHTLKNYLAMPVSHQVIAEYKFISFIFFKYIYSHP